MVKIKNYMKKFTIMEDHFEYAQEELVDYYSYKIKEFTSKFLKVNSNFYDELYSFLNMEQNKEYYKYKIPFKYISKEKAKEIYDEVIGDITFGGI